MTDKDYTSYVEQLEKLVANQGWDLTKHYRENSWCSFTRPNKKKVAFGIWFPSEKRLYLYIKRVHTEVQSFAIKTANHSSQWDQDEFLLEPRVTKLEAFLPLLKLAYSRC